MESPQITHCPTLPILKPEALNITKKYGCAAALVFIIILAAFLRLYHMPDRFFGNDVWLWTIGFNLHKLSFLNIGGHVTENFFKSLICTPYGWADTLPMYLASGIYNILNIPLNEFWIYFVHVFLNLVSIVLIYIMGKLLFNRIVGLISAVLLAILPIDITVFGSALYYHHAFLMFLELGLFLSLFYYMRNRRWHTSIFLSLFLLLAANTEILTILPAVLIFQFVLEDERGPALKASMRRFIKDIFTARYVLIWIPALCMVVLNVYIAIAFSDSNLGIFNYAPGKYMDGDNIVNFLNSTVNQFGMLYKNFFGIYLIAVALISLAYFTKRDRSFWRITGLLAWLVFMFFINVYFGQGFCIGTFRYSHYFAPLILIAGYMTYYLFDRLKALRVSVPIKRYLSIAAFIFFGWVFMYNALTVGRDVLNRRIYSDPLKSASFYVREKDGPNSTVFQLISLRDERNYRSEYYFGKPFMEPPEWTGLKRQLFSLGAHSIDEYKEAYRLEEFDFYVDYHGDNIGNGFLSKRGLEKVADIARNGKVITTIYSPHPLPYEIIDADAADRAWDNKYAGLERLLQNNWCGRAVLWGYYHRID